MRNELDVVEKTCGRCNHAKSVLEFHKHSGSRDGFMSHCKKCHTELGTASARRRRSNMTPAAKAALSDRRKQHAKDNREQLAEYAKTYRRDHREELLSKKLENRYGITLVEYYEMLAAQDYKCVGCIRSFDSDRVKINVDHCHTSGEVRGLLCAQCNAALGMVRDSSETLIRLVRYLKPGAKTA